MLIGHDAILRELQALGTQDDPPHALLFAGPEGTGRRLLARYYAQVLNCERRPGASPDGPGLFDPEPVSEPGEVPCGECRSCRLIESDGHPDVIELGPGDVLCKPRPGDSSHASHENSRDIRICQVRGMMELAARFPFEGRYRLIIIEPAERLARDASNTLLKTLEEPPGHTIIALVTPAPEALLETIVSRCRRIDVPPVAREIIEEGLKARGIDPALAAEAAQACRGRPGRAIQFAADPDLIGARGRLLERCARIAAASIAERFRYAEDLAERFRKDRAAGAMELDAWEAFWEDRLREAAPERGQAAAEALAALKAVTQCREDLLTQVVPRVAFELMLLTFPRRTLEGQPEEVPATHA